MEDRINIVIANNHFLVSEGLKCFVSSLKNIGVCSIVKNIDELSSTISSNKFDIVILDYSSSAFNFDSIDLIKSKSPSTKIIAVTPEINKIAILTAIKSGVNSHLLFECDKQEILEAINETLSGNKFYCGKVLDTIVERYNEVSTTSTNNSITSCDGVAVSDREIDIIALIAEGNSNKQIADKLCISLHTVNTHRKNIMAKLGVNNTAGIVLYAVREQILSPNKYLFS